MTEFTPCLSAACSACQEVRRLRSHPQGGTEALRGFTIAYERVIGGAPIAVLYRKSDGHPVLALSAGTTLDRIVAAAAPAPTDPE